MCCCTDFGATLSSSPVENLGLGGVVGVSNAGGGIPALVAGEPEVTLVRGRPLENCLDDVLLAGELDSARNLIDRGGDDISYFVRLTSLLRVKGTSPSELSLERVRLSRGW